MCTTDRAQVINTGGINNMLVINEEIKRTAHCKRIKAEGRAARRKQIPAASVSKPTIGRRRRTSSITHHVTCRLSSRRAENNCMFPFVFPGASRLCDSSYWSASPSLSPDEWLRADDKKRIMQPSKIHPADMPQQAEHRETQERATLRKRLFVKMQSLSVS